MNISLQAYFAAISNKYTNKIFAAMSSIQYNAKFSPKTTNMTAKRQLA